MSASDFHQIGVGVGAQPLTGTVAGALNASPSDVQSYYDTICSGQPALILPRLVAYPSDVPAYEAMFSHAQGECTLAADSLDRARGRVATSMIASQEFLDRLNRVTSSKVNTFCTTLDDNSEITKAAMSGAASALDVGETGSKLLEFGVTLVIKNCASLLSRLTD